MKVKQVGSYLENTKTRLEKNSNVNVPSLVFHTNSKLKYTYIAKQVLESHLYSSSLKS